MRRLFLLLSALPLLFIAPSAFAAKNQPNVVTLSADQVHNGDYFAFGSQVNIEGTVNGDLYAAGSIVTISGKVNGDVLVAGSQVTISGEVSQDVRAAGGQVTISGKVGRNISLGSGQGTLTNASSVGGSLVAAGGTLNLEGPIAGNLRLGGGDITVSNHIGGQIDSWVGTLTFANGADVKGKVNYVSNNAATVASGATVTGVITKTTPVHMENRESLANFLNGFNFFLRIIGFINLLVVGLLLLKFFPGLNTKVASNLLSKTWPSLGVGFVSIFMLPILAVILLFVLVTFPLGLSIIPLYIMLLYFSRVFVMYFVGVLILERFNENVHNVMALVLGILVFYVITFIPVIGSWLGFLATMAGIGALILAKKDIYSAAREKNII